MRGKRPDRFAKIARKLEKEVTARVVSVAAGPEAGPEAQERLAGLSEDRIWGREGAFMEELEIELLNEEGLQLIHPCSLRGIDSRNTKRV